MPSDEELRPKVNFNQNPELFEMVKRDAVIQDRSVSKIILIAVKRYYQERAEEAELFKNQVPGEKPAPVFVTPSPDQLAARQVAKIREMHGPEKS